MDLSKSILLPLGAIALVGACAPYPPAPYPGTPQQAVDPSQQQTLTGEEQRQLDEKRERLKRQEEIKRRNAQRERDGDRNDAPVRSNDKPKPKYPTAAAVPGKPGFVFNPYTHNIVDVKGIGSGKLCRDPEDSDPTHKFRVP